jgi:hypothetical protein
MHLPKREKTVFSKVSAFFEGHFPRKSTIFAISSVPLMDARFAEIILTLLLQVFHFITKRASRGGGSKAINQSKELC